MPGETRHTRERAELRINYAYELSEDITPEPGRAEIVVGPNERKRSETSHETRVFCYLTAWSALCLGAVALVPRPAVQATAVAIWAGSSGLTQYLHSGKRQRSRGKSTE